MSFFALIPPLKTGGTGTTQTVATQTTNSATCPAVTPVKDQQLTGTTFDAVTEFTLPSPARGPNAVAVAPDGSVWFGENGLPGIGHLYPNGTLTEYALPIHVTNRESAPATSSPSCGAWHYGTGARGR